MLIVNSDNPEKTHVTIMNIAESISSDLHVIKCTGQT
jgi:hypothetical protein